jgi:DNA-binding MarR family transcriptional regulator
MQTAAKTAQTLSRLTTYLMRVEPDMTIGKLHVFLFVAQRKDVLVRELVRATGLSQSAISRILAALGDKPHRGKREGLRWVTVTPDPDDPRRVFANVSDRGRTVLSDIEQLIS